MSELFKAYLIGYRDGVNNRKVKNAHDILDAMAATAQPTQPSPRSKSRRQVPTR